MSETNECLCFICFRLSQDFLAELTDKIHDALSKTSVRHSQIPRRKNPVQRDVLRRRHFHFWREDFLSPLRELLPDNLPNQVISEPLRGASRVPPIRGRPGTQPESGLDVSKCRISDVHPERSERLRESRREVIPADDVSDLTVGVV